MIVSQQAFTHALLDPGAETPPGLVTPAGDAAEKRFNVYRNNVAVSLTEALETAFPVIAKLIGAQNFKGLAALFLRTHPPKSPLIMFYGADMPEFLTGFAPLQHVPYIADIARLELALRQAYHAADATPLDPSEFETRPADEMMQSRFRFAPAVHLIRSRYPIHDIWQFNMTEDAPTPRAGGQNVLITRPEFDPIMTVLPAGGGTWVAALLDGASLSDALARTTAQVPDFDLTETLGHLLAGGALLHLDGPHIQPA